MYKMKNDQIIFDLIAKEDKRQRNGIELNIKISSENLIISDAAFLILPIHQLVDEVREKNNGSKKIGTTGRGIGPSYEDKVGRRGLRICDFLNKEYFESKLKKLYDFHNIWLTAMNEPKQNYNEVIKEIWSIGQKIIPFTKPSWEIIYNYKNRLSNILFEGAQGTFLDIDHGTYPFVTSSNTVSSQAGIGSGVGPTSMDYTLGITKAYTTRVGSGPFPSEDSGENGIKLGENDFSLKVRTSMRSNNKSDEIEKLDGVINFGILID